MHYNVPHMTPKLKSDQLIFYTILWNENRSSECMERELIFFFGKTYVIGKSFTFFFRWESL